MSCQGTNPDIDLATSAFFFLTSFTHLNNQKPIFPKRCKADSKARSDAPITMVVPRDDPADEPRPTPSCRTPTRPSICNSVYRCDNENYTRRGEFASVRRQRGEVITPPILHTKIQDGDCH